MHNLLKIVIVPCYCEHKKGDLSQNGLICIGSNHSERFDHCLSDEYCVGPDKPDKALRFARDTFCQRGKACLHEKYAIHY